jgi:hypothetical protein
MSYDEMYEYSSNMLFELLPVLEPLTSSRFRWKLLPLDLQVNVWRGCDEEVQTEKSNIMILIPLFNIT